MDKYLAIDVGGTGIKYALMDKRADILDQGEMPTPQETISQFLDAIESIYKKYKDQEPKAIVMSAPGRIDSERGWFYTGGALSYLHQRDLKTLLKERIPLPFCVENDAKCAALAELWKGSMRGVDSGIVMTLGTGIGGAVIIDGKLWRGHTFAAGELSGIPINWYTRSNGFGNAWTEINCTKSMLTRYAHAKGFDPDQVDGKTFFQAVRSNDPIAFGELEWFCETLATGLFALQLILDVEKISIGGGISRDPLLLKVLSQTIDKQYERMPWFTPASKPIVSVCDFSNDANLIGALYHYLYNVEQEPMQDSSGKEQE